MKRNLFLLAIAAICLIGCNQNEPTVSSFSFDFNYYISTDNPLKVNFYPRFEGKSPTSVTWDFGDGAASSFSNTTHIYSKGGTYKVVLLVYYEDIGMTFRKEKSVTVKEQADYSKTPYISGFTLYSIYNAAQKIYVRFELVGTTLMGTNTINIKTEYGDPLTGAESLPYSQFIYPSVKIGDTPSPFDWYKEFTIKVYQAASLSASGVCSLSKTISASELEKTTEYIVTSEINGTKVGILFEYK